MISGGGNSMITEVHVIPKLEKKVNNYVENKKVFIFLLSLSLL